MLGRYALYEKIASGGMASVHIGRLLGPVGFARTVAVKRLHPQFAENPQFVSIKTELTTSLDKWKKDYATATAPSAAPAAGKGKGKKKK